jgi:hypothetical protein
MTGPVMPRTETKPQLDIPASRELLEGLLTLPGSTGETYRRFYNYSPRNVGFLALQGCPPEPVATFKRWQELGRHVTKGSKAFSILRPIQVKVEREDEETLLVRRFKVVRALFAASQTAGDDLPHYIPAHWDEDQALDRLDVTRVPFRSYEGNVGGYAVGRTIAINPVAPFPLRTTLHEISHIQNGHTSPENVELYREHRGTFEFEAEASAHIVLNEIGELDSQTAEVSRGYCQSWMGNEQPKESSIKKVLDTATIVLASGQVEVRDA